MTEAVVFDVMGTLFDLSPLRDRLRAAGAPEGSLEAWFGRMLHGSAALTLVGEFRPFRDIGKASLESVLAQLEADVSKTDEIVQGLGELDPYPDAAAAFDHVRGAGVRIATLTNGAEDHTRRLLARAELEHAVELVIAVDEVRAYKPHAAPYHHAAARLGLPVERVTLIAAHGWDVVGARAAGLGAVWIDRLERRWPLPLPEPVRATTLVEAVERALAEVGAR
jgi:2-haloacid dehalogenase